MFDDEWRDIDFSVVGVAEGDVDVAGLACGQQLSPTYPFEASTVRLVYGQRAYSWGFRLDGPLVANTSTGVSLFRL